MSPHPNKVDVHHGITAKAGTEEMHPEKAIQPEECGRDG